MYTSKIIAIKKEVKDVLTFVMEKPQNFKYSAGQYGIFEHKFGDEIIRRSYSFSSSPTEDFLAITVRYIPNGKMTTYLFDLVPGDCLAFNAPLGKFSMEGVKKAVLIGGGSGVTPFRSMGKYAFDKTLDADITLIYGARNPKEILFNEEFHYFLKNPKFKLYLTVDRPDESWHFHAGFIDSNFIKEATNNDPLGRCYFLCGPPAMLNAIQKALMGLGVPESTIILDAWG
jgi:glycine betaine catabolism B